MRRYKVVEVIEGDPITVVATKDHYVGINTLTVRKGQCFDVHLSEAGVFHVPSLAGGYYGGLEIGRGWAVVQK